METYYGNVRTPLDAILLFEACRLGVLPRVQRRLSEKERQSIRSGSVFVWDEGEAGMRRWTDGKSWSASRVSGSFLTYREMEGRRADQEEDNKGSATTSATASPPNQGPTLKEEEDGPSSDGYKYKPNGLIKQSFSVTTSTNLKLHLISYYTRSAAEDGDGLPCPSQDSSLKSIVIPKGLYPDASSPVDPRAVPQMAMSPGMAPAPLSGPYGYPVHMMRPDGRYGHELYFPAFQQVPGAVPGALPGAIPGAMPGPLPGMIPGAGGVPGYAVPLRPIGAVSGQAAMAAPPPPPVPVPSAIPGAVSGTSPSPANGSPNPVLGSPNPVVPGSLPATAPGTTPGTAPGTPSPAGHPAAPGGFRYGPNAVQVTLPAPTPPLERDPAYRRASWGEDQRAIHILDRKLLL